MGTWADTNGWFVRMQIQDDFLLYYLLVIITLFPIIMYGHVSWTIEKCPRIDTFQLSCWRTLEGLLDCKETRPVHPEGNQPWIFIGRNDAEAKAPFCDPLMWRADLLEKPLMLGKVEDKRRWGWQRIRWLDSTTDLKDMNISQILGDGGGQRSLRATVHGVAESDTIRRLNSNKGLSPWARGAFLS